MSVQKIRPFMWYNDDAEDAANFYVSVFKDSKVTTVSPGPGGRAMSVEFTLEGQQFLALNGGPHFQFNEAVSLFVNCETQEEVDYFWSKFIENGGSPSQCGWLKDKWGVSWQIIPTALTRLLRDKDAAKAGRVMQAMMQMVKIDVAGLQKAYDGQ